MQIVSNIADVGVNKNMHKITKRVYIGFLNLAEQSMYFKSFLNGDNANK